jgi:hypothetical protein
MGKKYQTVNVIMAGGTAQGKYTNSIELDSHFDGVRVIEISTGGINYYDIGLEDKATVHHSITHKQDFLSTINTDINARYKDVLIPIIQGDKVDIRTQLPVPLISELHYQIIFRLRKKAAK